MQWSCNIQHIVLQQYFWVRVFWCTALVSSTLCWPLTRKIARASSTLAFQRAVAAAVDCFCSQQRKCFTWRERTCSLHIQEVAEKQDWQRRSFVFCLHFHTGRMEYVVVAFSVKTDLLHFQWKSLLHFPKQTHLTTNDVMESQVGGEYWKAIRGKIKG